MLKILLDYIAILPKVKTCSDFLYKECKFCWTSDEGFDKIKQILNKGHYEKKILFTACAGSGIIAYIIAAIVMPRKSDVIEQ